MNDIKIMPYNSMRLVYEAARSSCPFDGRCCFCEFEKFCSYMVKAYKEIPDDVIRKFANIAREAKERISDL